MNDRLYVVDVKAGGTFLYDTIDVGRFALRMAEHRDDRYLADMRSACAEDQGTPDGKAGTLGREMQERLRALKETVRVL